MGEQQRTKMESFDILPYLLFFTFILVQAFYFLRKKVKLPPGPTPLPIIGNLLLLRHNPHRSLAKLAVTHGPLMSLKLGQVTAIVVSSADMAKQVLQNHDLALSTRAVNDAISACDHDQSSIIFLPPNATWRNLRKICNSTLFAHQKLEGNQHLRSEKVRELVAEVRECSRLGVAVEIGEAAFKTTLSLLSNSIFSADLADQKGFKKLAELVLEEAGKPNIADYFPFLRKIDPQGSKRRLGVYYGKAFQIFSRMIDDRLAQKSKSSSNDMLDALLQMNREEGFDRASIEHLLFDLFMAGIDAPTKTIERVMAKLIRYPEKLRKAQAELEQSVGKGNPVKESDISKLPYLQAVVKETMRLHPAVPLLLTRKAEADVEISGFTIPKGAQVVVNAWAIGRDPTTWENPNRFVPERFIGSEIDVKGLDFGLIPFGGGRRICPGMPLAIRMVHLILASLIHGFDWKLEKGVKAEEMDMEDEFGLVLRMTQPVKAIPVSLTSN